VVVASGGLIKAKAVGRRRKRTGLIVPITPSLCACATYCVLFDILSLRDGADESVRIHLETATLNAGECARASLLSKSNLHANGPELVKVEEMAGVDDVPFHVTRLFATRVPHA